ncbi:MAG: hypothetical protein ACRDKT_02325 [Actinomycetota bacterium]
MRVSHRLLLGAVAGALVLGSCAELIGSGGPPDAPPPVTIHFDGDEAELEPWTYCYGNGCADGAPPENPVDVGSPEEVIVGYPLEDWTFRASFTPAGKRCGRSQSAKLDETENGDFVVRPLGFAGTYDVTLTGRGDGDLFVTFRWTTPVDGPLPKPKAYIGVLSDNDGEVDSYGVELSISNMSETPEKARATITVTSSEGNSLTFDATKRRRRCVAEGSLYWNGPHDKGLEAAELGSPPFEYDVVLKLDGKRYKARATWPDDQIPWLRPYVWLRFRPRLPTLHQ